MKKEIELTKEQEAKNRKEIEEEIKEQKYQEWKREAEAEDKLRGLQ